MEEIEADTNKTSCVLELEKLILKCLYYPKQLHSSMVPIKIPMLFFHRIEEACKIRESQSSFEQEQNWRH